MWAGGNAIFNDIIDGHSSVINHYLNSSPQTEGLKDIKGLMGGIIAMLEAMGGVPKHTHGINDFFTIAELKNHLLQQIVAEQNDNTAQSLFSEKEFMAWLERGITSLGELVTFRDMMKLLFNWIYYESVPVTSPMYVPGVAQTTSTKKVKISGSYNYPQPVDDLLATLAETAKVRDQLTAAGISSTGSLLVTQGPAALDMAAQIKTLLLTPELNPQVTKQLKNAQSFLRSISKPASKDPPSKTAKNWRSVHDALVRARAAGQDTDQATTANKTVTNAPQLDRLQTQSSAPIASSRRRRSATCSSRSSTRPSTTVGTSSRRSPGSVFRPAWRSSRRARSCSPATTTLRR